MNYLKSLFILVAFCQLGVLQTNAQNIKLSTEVDSMSFFLGYMYGKQLGSYGVDVNVDIISSGFRDAFAKTPINISDEEINLFLQNYFTGLQSRENAKYLKEGQDFLAVNAKRPEVKTLPSGLQYKVLKEGTGIKPSENDDVAITYHGTLIDGTVFDSSRDRGDTVTFQPNNVIAGFTEALTLMNEGSKWEVYIPAELGYGENVNPASGIKPNSVLIFEIDLVRVTKEENDESDE